MISVSDYLLDNPSTHLKVERRDEVWYANIYRDDGLSINSSGPAFTPDEALDYLEEDVTQARAEEIRLHQLHREGILRNWKS